MAKESKIMVDDVHVDPHTGHITVWVYMHTEDGNVKLKGPRRGYGCDAGMFQGMFGGDIEQFNSWIVSQHQFLTGVHLDFVDTLMKMKGTHIGPVQILDSENKDA